MDDILYTDFNQSQPAGLYIHIPFCLKKCAYCDFYSIIDLSLKPTFLAALEEEMRLVRNAPLCFDTVYIGGGTPSVLKPAEIGSVIANAFRYFNIQSDAEITLEVNPGSITSESLAAYHRAGINRVNIGVQSFQDTNLHFLGRIHTARDAFLSVEWARHAGFSNVGLDLIYGLPDQDKENLLSDLKRAVDLNPEHLSCYMLTLESGTPMDRDVKRGRIRMPEEGAGRVLFDTTIDYLTDNGFDHYEISNFAGTSGGEVGSNRSRHNLKYWSFSPYRGFGPAAHSFVEPRRFWNHRSVDVYIRQIDAGKVPVAGKETLTKEQMVMETIYMGFRTTQGIDMDGFYEKYGLNFKQTFNDAIVEFENRGLLRFNGKYCALTREGLPLLDSVAAVFVDQDIS